MTVKAKWIRGRGLIAELDMLSNKAIPIWCNQSFLSDLKKSFLFDYRTGPTGQTVYLLGDHPIYFDPKAPDYACAQDIVDYSWMKHGHVIQFAAIDTCQCKLGGGHELWCSQWQPYTADP